MDVENQSNRSRIMFFSNSKHTYPGTGASESLSDKDKQNKTFDALHSFFDFRKKLSNFYELENGFFCDGRHWLTVEHCFQGRKFEDISTDYCHSFSLESGSELSRSGGASARKAGSKRQYPLTMEQLSSWDARKIEVMKEALYAKFTQFSEMKSILLATHDAELVHRLPRSKLIVEHSFMQIREQLKAEQHDSR